MTDEVKAYKEGQKLYVFLLSVGIVLFVFMFFWSICHGNYSTSFSDVMNSFLHPDSCPDVRRIVILSRLPRLIGSVFVGAALSVSGLVYQELFYNRMASPDLLGVSAGSGAGAAIAILAGSGFGATSVFAFFGGVIAVLLTRLASRLFGRKTDKSVSLILAGIVIGGLMNSIMSLFKYISNDAQLATITFWLMGGFYNTTYKQLVVAVPGIIIGIGILWPIRYRISLLRESEKGSITLGVNVKVIKNLCVIVATVITALSICISGTIGWIGLAIPNLVRELVKNDGKKLFSLTLVYGAVFTELCDYLARTLSKTEIPVGIISGILGAIMFIAVLVVRKRRKY